MLDNSQIDMGENVVVSARRRRKKLKWACQANSARGSEGWGHVINKVTVNYLTYLPTLPMVSCLAGYDYYLLGAFRSSSDIPQGKVWW